MNNALRCIAVFCVIFCVNSQFNPPHPRLGFLMWGGLHVQHMKRFDWIIMPFDSAESVARAKALAAAEGRQIWASGTLDINDCTRIKNPCPPEWRVRWEANEGYVNVYGQKDQFLGDTASERPEPPCPSQRLSTGMTYREAIVANALAHNYSVFDGWHTDGFWESVYWMQNENGSHIDVNCDGVHDVQVDNRLFEQGRIKLMEELRAAMGTERSITAWTALSGVWNQTMNGVGWEKFTLFAQFDWIHSVTEVFNQVGAFRPMNYFNGHYETDDREELSYDVRLARENYRAMRFGLGTSVIHEGYYGYEDGAQCFGSGCQVWNEHFWINFYDEYELQLGYPLHGSPVIIEGFTHLWIRFFDGGVVLVNGGQASAVVSEVHLVAAATALNLDWANITRGNGHYYRFLGQMDVENDGSQFETATLLHNGNRLGDALFLVNNGPNHVVMTPVVVDNLKYSSTPGVAGVQLLGAADAWYGSCGNRQNTEDVRGWRVGYRWCSHVNPYYHYLLSNGSATGAATAMFAFQPRIGGRWAVSEFHPSWQDVQNTAVEHRVQHKDGQSIYFVDQTRNGEQWNELGIFTFDAGVSYRVAIVKEAGAPEVAADAIQFRFVGDSSESLPTSTVPDAPTGDTTTNAPTASTQTQSASSPSSSQAQSTTSTTMPTTATPTATHSDADMQTTSISTTAESAEVTDMSRPSEENNLTVIIAILIGSLVFCLVFIALLVLVLFLMRRSNASSSRSQYAHSSSRTGSGMRGSRQRSGARHSRRYSDRYSGAIPMSSAPRLSSSYSYAAQRQVPPPPPMQAQFYQQQQQQQKQQQWQPQVNVQYQQQVAGGQSSYQPLPFGGSNVMNKG